MSALLEVKDLTVSFSTDDGVVRAVQGVSLEVQPGQTLAIVGESGSGKTVTALTLLGLAGHAQVGGSAMFDGTDLLHASTRDMRRIRGAEIGMIFQDPLSSLHPHYRVGWQIAEMLRNHRKIRSSDARRMSIELLHEVGIPEPQRNIDSYPHELSGGMRQRVMIAMALALRPKLLIADEPTTALDATVQAQIVQLIGRLQRELGMAMIIITHDLGVVARIATSVLVMYAGRAAEFADRHSLYYRPHHPYTTGLLRSVPAATGAKGRLIPIAGQPPSLLSPPSGCVFHPRCPHVMPRCVDEAPPLHRISESPPHESACWLPDQLQGLDAETEKARFEYSGAATVRHE